MAQRVITQYVDDLTGKEVEGDVYGVQVAVKGTGLNWAREYDLGDEGFKVLTEIMEELAEGGRDLGHVREITIGRPRSAARREGGGVSRGEAAQIRDWAKREGLEVNDRGRIPAHVTTAYREAHGGAA